MPIAANPDGVLDIENATLRSREIATLSNFVAGNDEIRSSGAPVVEIYGDPANVDGVLPTLELVSNTGAVTGSSFTRFTSNAGVLTLQSGTNGDNNSKGDIAFSSIGGVTEHMRIKGSSGNVGIGIPNPSVLLDLKRDSVNGCTIKFESSGGYTSSISQKSSASTDRSLQFTSYPYAGSSVAYNFLTWNSSNNGWNEPLKITGDGNIAIGATPQTSLKLNVTSRSRPSAHPFCIGGDGANYSSYFSTHFQPANNAGGWNRVIQAGGSERPGWARVAWGTSNSGSGTIAGSGAAVVIFSTYGNNVYARRAYGDTSISYDNGVGQAPNFNGIRIYGYGSGSYHKVWFETYHFYGILH